MRTSGRNIWEIHAHRPIRPNLSRATIPRPSHCTLIDFDWVSSHRGDTTYATSTCRRDRQPYRGFSHESKGVAISNHSTIDHRNRIQITSTCNPAGTSVVGLRVYQNEMIHWSRELQCASFSFRAQKCPATKRQPPARTFN